MPATELLTAQEMDLLLAAVQNSAAGERVRAMAVAVIRLCLDTPMRISEVLNLRLRDLTSPSSGSILTVENHRGGWRPKTEHTVRKVSIICRLARQSLEAWKQRRLDEGADINAFLFGDGFEGGRGKDAVTMYVLVNRLLKEVSGEQQMSFHSLRHTCISLLVKDALVAPRTQRDVDPLDEVAARAGHASAVTSLVTYSHLYHLPLRRHLLMAVAPFMTVRGTARFCGAGESALSQRIARAALADRGAVLIQALEVSASKLGFEHADARVGMALIHHAVVPSKRMSVLVMLEIPSDIDGGRADELVALRHGVDVVRIQAVKNIRTGLPAIKKLQVRETQWRQLKLAALLERINSGPHRPLVVDALRSWDACLDRGFLSAANANLLEGVMRLFKNAGVPVSRLILRTSDAHADALTNCLDQFVAIFNGRPAVELVPHRRDRPTLYLLLSSTAACASHAAPPAAIGTAGCNAIFSALRIVHLLDGPAGDEEVDTW